MKASAEAPKKNSYQPPRLMKYGSLIEMTAAHSTGAMTDPQKGGGNKTV